MKRAQAMVGWYTQDFVVRIRVCTQCKFRDFTVELPLDDIKGIVRETFKGHAPKTLTQKENEHESSHHHRELGPEA